MALPDVLCVDSSLDDLAEPIIATHSVDHLSHVFHHVLLSDILLNLLLLLVFGRAVLIEIMLLNLI